MAETRGKEPKRDVEVITTHLNADYDALASMLAAAKLFPKAMLVFPGSQERNLRNFYVESTCYLYNFVKVKQVPFERVRRLIIVDTRQKSRLGPLAPLADDPAVEVIAYDHHPDSDEDVTAAQQTVKAVGSTVTLLSGLLREKGIRLNEDEATIMALGIYEDTGNFTFVSTTPADYEAAAWLLQQGANLPLVSSLITRELTAEDVALLGDLISNAVTMNVGGVPVVISEVSVRRYVPEFAVLVHKFMDMENLDVLFALARMEGRVHLVARSRLPQVDAGAIATAMGGGGHPSAASATMRDLTLVEARAKLERLIRTQVNPARKARELMSSPVITVEAGATLAEAHDLLNRFNLNTLPVVREGRVLGLLSRQIVEKSLQHDLGDFAVTEYMDSEVMGVDAGDGLAEVETALLDRRQRMTPVLEDGRLAGVITRTDLLHTLVDDTPLMPVHLNNEARTGRHAKRLTGLMRERLPREVIKILRDLGATARDLDYRAYLVGGSVRDLFLRRQNLDLDVVVEGEGILFAQAYAAERPKVRVRPHKKFNTAVLVFPNGFKIDVATARLEYYQSPAALPVVELSSLRQDLYRRDFTINTLALELNPDSFGSLIDFFGGLKDLKEKAVRVLHNLSFVDDPTRVLRAVRFEQRLGFRIGRFTEGLIKNALKIEAFKRLSGRRLFSEYSIISAEERAAQCILRLGDLGVLTVLHEKIRLDPAHLELLEAVEETLAWFRLSFIGRPLRNWLLYLLALTDGLSDRELDQACLRLALGPRQRAEIGYMREDALKALNMLQRSQMMPSQVYNLLKPLRPAFQLFIMAKASVPHARQAISQYLTALAHVQPELNGADLKAMGFTPGPLFKKILDRLREARLDGELTSRQEEAQLVVEEFMSDKEQAAWVI